jgi:hypothetical protein
MMQKNWHLCCAKCEARTDFFGWDMHRPLYCQCGGAYTELTDNKSYTDTAAGALAPYVSTYKPQQRTSDPAVILADVFGNRWPDVLGG